MVINKGPYLSPQKWIFARYTCTSDCCLMSLDEFRRREREREREPPALICICFHCTTKNNQQHQTQPNRLSFVFSLSIFWFLCLISSKPISNLLYLSRALIYFPSPCCSSGFSTWKKQFFLSTFLFKAVFVFVLFV